MDRPRGSDRVVLDGLELMVHPEEDNLLFRESRLESDQEYGQYSLGQFHPFPLVNLNPWIFGPTEESEFLVQAGEILFLDTEATGLSRGAGTIAFMIGLGFFEPDGGFLVRQYFLKDLQGEEQMLRELGRLFDQFRFLVTFNGSGFDIPLLKTRLTLAWREPARIPLYSFDLFHFLKRIFKGELENHRLQTYEEKTLGVRRTDDLGGDRVPQVYFDYLRYGETENISRIFMHNELDIISLAFLYLGLTRKLNLEKPHRGDSLRTRSNLAQILARNRDGRSALRLVEPIPLKEFIRQGAWAELFFQALLFKRLRQFEKALPAFETLASQPVRPEDPARRALWPVLAAIEGAKILEHRHANYAAARNITRRALWQLREYQADTDYTFSDFRRKWFAQNLDRRLQRLEEKIKKA